MPGHDEVKKSRLDVGIASAPSSLGRNPRKGTPMPKTIFISLPVSDVARSTAFYQALGAVKNEAFSDHSASSIAFAAASASIHDTPHT